MRLSVREKILLYLLIIMAVVFLGLRYLLFPLMQNYRNHSAELSNLAVSQNIAAQEIAGTKNASSALQQEKAKAVSAAASLLPEPQSYLINVWIVNLAEKNGMSVGSVRFSAPTAASIGSASSASTSTASTPSSTGGVNDYLMKQYVQAFITGAAAGSAQSGTASGELCKISVNLTMTGPSLGQVETFFDAVKNSGKTAVITSLDCSVQPDNTCAVTVTIDCYGTVKLDNSDSTFSW